MADSGQDSVDAGSEPSTSTGHVTPGGIQTPVYTGEEFQDRTYRMNSEKRGLAIIFDNKKFKNKPTRTGTDKDAGKMYQRFMELGFTVNMHPNKKASEMKSIIKKVAASDFTSYDCFACVILSYGEEGLVYGTDEPVQIEDFVDPFKKTPSLAGKPKLFFIQACDREEPEGGDDVNDAMCVAESVADAPSGSLETHIIPKEADILIAHSTVPGYFSWQGHRQRGSWFIQAFCDVLKKFGTKEDLLNMMQRVNCKVAYEFEFNAKFEFLERNKQLPCITSMLTKEVRFYSK
ncbi:caspase-3-like [Haliotis rubra]|uniref:caspase-3-like n=1 Tax=Haliotis rubra TaxID=36100 RepID=UPI001EE5AE33|nr:caspase-3-like [Haliotis rubra]